MEQYTVTGMSCAACSARVEKAVSKVEGVKITIEKMKKTPAELPWYMSVEQLEMTLKELDNMNRIRDMRQFMPYYPRGIADSWEFDDKLGNELLEVLDYYMKF